MNQDNQPQLLTHVAVLATAVALASCSGGAGSAAPGVSAPQAEAPRPITQSDLEIAAHLYDGSPRTPAGFYSDAAPSGHSVVTTTHLKNADIETAPAPLPLHELCTDDWNEALAWSELSAQRASEYADLVTTNDDARYFEFGRTGQEDPGSYQRARVFKCAYLDRSTANLRETGGPAGQLNRRPLSAVELQTLSEYLWQFTPYNNFGHVVLESSGQADAGGLMHTLHIGSLVRDGLSPTCDRIDVIAWRHELDPASGELRLEVETLWSFGARESGGVAELCSA